MELCYRISSSFMIDPMLKVDLVASSPSVLVSFCLCYALFA